MEAIQPPAKSYKSAGQEVVCNVFRCCGVYIFGEPYGHQKANGQYSVKVVDPTN